MRRRLPSLVKASRDARRRADAHLTSWAGMRPREPLSSSGRTDMKTRVGACSVNAEHDLIGNRKSVSELTSSRNKRRFSFFLTATTGLTISSFSHTQNTQKHNT